MVLDHAVVFTADGGHTTEHPDPDRDGCDFDAYVQRDWSEPQAPGVWLFAWQPGDDTQPEGYWNGTPKPEAE